MLFTDVITWFILFTWILTSGKRLLYIYLGKLSSTLNSLTEAKHFTSSPQTYFSLANGVIYLLRPSLKVRKFIRIKNFK